MAPAWETLELRSRSPLELIDITDRVGAGLPAGSGGAVALFTPHATAALLLNENEEGLQADIRSWLERAVPAAAGYAHDRVDDNAAAHLRAILLGPSLVVPVREGRLSLGQWQRIFFVELDGPRKRQVWVRLLA